MESILNELKVNCDDCDADEQGTLSDTDEVTIMYYGSACNCSKRSTCSNAACCCKKMGKNAARCVTMDKSNCVKICRFFYSG